MHDPFKAKGEPPLQILPWKLQATRWFRMATAIVPEAGNRIEDVHAALKELAGFKEKYNFLFLLFMQMSDHHAQEIGEIYHYAKERGVNIGPILQKLAKKVGEDD